MFYKIDTCPFLIVIFCRILHLSKKSLKCDWPHLTCKQYFHIVNNISIVFKCDLSTFNWWKINTHIEISRLTFSQKMCKLKTYLEYQWTYKFHLSTCNSLKFWVCMLEIWKFGFIFQNKNQKYITNAEIHLSNTSIILIVNYGFLILVFISV